ncbi:hypothetical protein CFP71_42225 [Amycolatopsis thailandensis]|uniref:Uncharacterized protein n=1 Tax=Amycolatopsis thailandensis TaxID=589330 RepID=A0A229R7W2_9PSEU|nr:hypothetical protein [Amycolatopsis thailandensis]OXM42750.1 hypothetical protein CFP71_42225 [Amycolatopsis thailandensis]
MAKGYFEYLVKGNNKEARGSAGTEAAAWTAAGRRAPGYFTDKDGLISISVNGKTISVKKEHLKAKIAEMVSRS